MRTPKAALTVEDLGDAVIREALKACRLNGCYLFAPLREYGFLADFVNLEDLYILHGESVRDLFFARHLPMLFMFYLQGAVLEDLRPLIDNCNEGCSGPGKCFGFHRCKIRDISALRECRFVLSELIVTPAEGDFRARWQESCRPGIFRYYGGN